MPVPSLYPMAGLARNPYVESGSPCGSSSGSSIAVATNMVTISLGTETDGSIICPAHHNSVVGLKPTVGLTSRAVLKSSPPSSTTSTWIPQRGGVVPPCRQCYRCYKASNMANA
ncbi:hypothetical protein JHK82_032660 [Glycine max]|nr:hypothetical protein JHK86_032752 [Glycine max]KAG5118240.1 hypothetical protein JHK82_032660 [Glycine max]KAG5139224.1 hypothetical protein JHK84_032992 [Glycine max]